MRRMGGRLAPSIRAPPLAQCWIWSLTGGSGGLVFYAAPPSLMLLLNKSMLRPRPWRIEEKPERVE